MVSSRMSSRMERRPRAPVLRAMALRATAFRASSVNVRPTFSMSNRRTYCFTKAFFGSVRIFTRAFSARSSRVAITGRRPTNSGIRPKRSRSSGSTWRNTSPVRRSSGSDTLAPKPMEVPCPRAGVVLSRAPKGPAADEQDVGGVDLQELLLRMLAPALRRHGGDGAFHDLQQRLLHALARHVAGG